MEGHGTPCPYIRLTPPQPAVNIWRSIQEWPTLHHLARHVFSAGSDGSLVVAIKIGEKWHSRDIADSTLNEC